MPLGPVQVGSEDNPTRMELLLLNGDARGTVGERFPSGQWREDHIMRMAHMPSFYAAEGCGLQI